MRENRTHGSEGGESGSTGLPYPYRALSMQIVVVATLARAWTQLHLRWPRFLHRLATVATFALSMLIVVVATLARAWTQPHLRWPRFFHRLATVATFALAMLTVVVATLARAWKKTGTNRFWFSDIKSMLMIRMWYLTNTTDAVWQAFVF